MNIAIFESDEPADAGTRLRGIDAEQTARELPDIAAADLGQLGFAALAMLGRVSHFGHALEAAEHAKTVLQQLILSLEGMEDQAVDDDGEGLRRFLMQAREQLPPGLRPHLDIEAEDIELGPRWLADAFTSVADLLGLAESVAGIHYRTHNDPQRAARISGALAAARVAVTTATDLNTAGGLR
ncbi:hypothetical protein ACQP0C_41705 (plasmid) [Nocardia sp. CA-129566]|uniref:hypothetical protein n=1 Tax=Nocardia sp. CA-129566 TaxID=3239976 RepID=UPI003D97DBA2